MFFTQLLKINGSFKIKIGTVYLVLERGTIPPIATVLRMDICVQNIFSIIEN